MKNKKDFQKNAGMAVLAVIAFLWILTFLSSQKASHKDSLSDPNKQEDIRNHTPVMELLPKETNEPNNLAE